MNATNEKIILADFNKTKLLIDYEVKNNPIHSTESSSELSNQGFLEGGDIMTFNPAGAGISPPIYLDLRKMFGKSSKHILPNGGVIPWV